MTTCPYCEKERKEVNFAMNIDNDFSYSCIVCNLEYINWRDNKAINSPYANLKCQKELELALKHDKDNNDYFWNLHLKTITERSEIYVRENTED